MKRNSRIYIAGHTGLVGCTLVRRLRADGHGNLLLRTSQALDLGDANVGWFCQEAPAEKAGVAGPITISGTGKQVRAVLHGNDMRPLYFASVERRDASVRRGFDLAGGIGNSLSLLELFALLERLTDQELEVAKLARRASDQKAFVTDVQAARNALGFAPSVSAERGVSRMLEWLRDTGLAGC